MADLIEILKTSKTYFTGTADELREYKMDRVMGLLYFGEIAASFWVGSEFMESKVNYWVLPFALDMVARIGYHSIHNLFEKRDFKASLVKSGFFEDLAFCGLSRAEIKKKLRSRVNKESDGLFPPGIIGVIRQKGLYKPMIGSIEEN